MKSMEYIPKSHSESIKDIGGTSLVLFIAESVWLRSNKYMLRSRIVGNGNGHGKGSLLSSFIYS